MYLKQPVKSFKKDALYVEIFEDDQALGATAANKVARNLESTINKNGIANLILATGASQFAFLEALQQIETIEWGKINVFHLDEYIEMPETHPASFVKYLKERILNKVKPLSVNFLHGDADDIDKQLKRYENLLKENPTDIACIGIGENGHIAFNDPPVADFNDNKWVKTVELDEPCRKQQFDEGWFETLDDVPTTAYTLTIPAIMNSKVISCVVPDKRKAEAVYNTINGDINEECPATILRKHDNVVLYLDENSAEKIL